MAQYYPKPEDVLVPYERPTPYQLRKLKEIIAKDGLIVPILVHKLTSHQFFAASKDQGDKVIACRDLNFETLLVETEWNEEDL